MIHVHLARMREKQGGRGGELAAAAITASGKFIFGDWLGLRLEYTIGAIAFWVVYVVLRHKSDPTVLKRWGFRREGIAESTLLSTIALAAGTLFCVLFALVFHTAVLNWNFVALLLLYPAWGLIQQFLLVGILADNLMALTRERIPEFVVVMITALTFSSIHFPETPLMIGTFFLGIATTLIFFRTRNIWPLGVLHGWFATLFYYLVMKDDVFAPMIHAVVR